jgi:hypothetical protein
MFDYDPPWMSLFLMEEAEPWAARSGVSEVARGPRGFLTAYKLASGEPACLTWDPHSGHHWTDVRRRFVNRFVQQAKINREKWWTKKGHPTRRHLALIMWAYSPTPRRVADWLRSVQ